MKIEIIITIALGAIVAAVWLRKFRYVFIVPEGYAGLLYRHGKFAETLGAGRHVRWGRNVTVDPMDLRKTTLAIAGQEVLTADNVSLKISVLIGYQVTDPVKAAHESQSWHIDLHYAAQLALRAVVSGVAIEALLSQRLDIGKQLLAAVQPVAEKFGVTVHAAEVKDAMFPAELKRAFAETLKAKQEGQAALERARGEGAALRNLANAARVLEGNPALMNLRLIQSLTAAQNAGNTLVVGMPGGFVPLKTGKAVSPAPNTEDDGAS
jgi:regulator of protease activity HflC (stomatin/prohibitin superfamily)